jgi:hypothetical protein
MREPPSREAPGRFVSWVAATLRPPDPALLAVLLTLLVITGVAVHFAHDLLPSDHEAPVHILQLAAAILVGQGLYFTALTLTFNRAQKRIELLGEAIDRLDAKDEAVRIGAVWTFEHIAYDAPRSGGQRARTLSVHRAISAALEATEPRTDAFTRARDAVLDTLAYLDPRHFSPSKK